jgi:hypothetical protein
MLIEPLILASDDEAGLDFGDFFEDAGLVNAALRKLAGQLDPTICCYCLEFHSVEGGRSWFKPYGCDRQLNGLVTDGQVQVPPQIFYDRLVRQRQSDNECDFWPTVAKWQLNGDDPNNMPAILKNAGFHVQMRLQRNEKYIGYFKVAMFGSCSANDEFRIRSAFESVKEWLRGAVAQRRHTRMWLDAEFKRAVLRLQADVASLLVAPPPAPWRALRLLCTLITSHLTQGFNRIAFLTRGKYDDLYCAYAHGGDCTEGFSAGVQRLLAESAHSIDELKDWVDCAVGPSDDPLFVELAGSGKQVLKIPKCEQSKSLVARIWRDGARLSGVGNAAVAAPSGPDIQLPRGVIHWEPSTVLAAEIGRDDELLAQWAGSHPESAWLAARNNRFFVLPWHGPERPLGIFMLDLGYWGFGSIELARDVIPRLLFVRAILSEFSADFAGAEWL